MIKQDHCRHCLAKPNTFSECPDISGPAPRRSREKMFELAMTPMDPDPDDEDDGTTVIRLLAHDWYIEPISTHPFVDKETGIDFDPYALPRCIEHDFSEGLIEFLSKEIFSRQIGNNDAERARKCKLICENINWFPGSSSATVMKIPSVRPISQPLRINFICFNNFYPSLLHLYFTFSFC